MKHGSPTVVSTYAYVNPVVAVILGWWIMNERIDARIVSASAAIVAGVALISYSKHSLKAPVAPESPVAPEVSVEPEA
jgi:drug/metabolite transporter (DMT)-like permease